MKQSLALFLLCALALAADLTGSWSGSFKAEGADHSVSQVIILKQQGSMLSGSAGPMRANSTQLRTGEWTETKSASR